ncbi:MAG: hypothetical protein CYG60_12295 [Actinobacteria bacterium]|nr:MAG: hypothetical protein CYG60_12295 [Actinomycetota bacterium]
MRVEPSAARGRSYDGEYMRVGKEGEMLAFEFLRSRPDIALVTDVREQESYQHRDIDFVVRTTRGQTVNVEVKRDIHLGTSGNVLFELARIYHTAHPNFCVKLGWSVRSGADIFLFYAPSTEEMYLCGAKRFRKALQDYTYHARQRTQLRLIPTDAIKSTLNVLVPWEDCEDIFKVYSMREETA